MKIKTFVDCKVIEKLYSGVNVGARTMRQCVLLLLRRPLVNTATFLRKTPRFSRVNRKAEKIVKTPPFLRYILKLTFFQGFCPVFLLGLFQHTYEYDFGIRKFGVYPNGTAKICSFLVVYF
jgi:hypothetical protein